MTRYLQNTAAAFAAILLTYGAFVSAVTIPAARAAPVAACRTRRRWWRSRWS